MEVWKTSNEFIQIEVSNLGQVRFADTKELLIIKVSQDAVYVQFRLKGNTKQTGRRVKILVARAFLSPSNLNHVVCIDGDMLNVAASNLEYRSRAKPYKLKKTKLPRDEEFFRNIEILDKIYMDKLDPFK